MKNLIYLFFLTLSSVSLAQPTIELPAMAHDSACAQQAAQLIVRYTDLFDLGVGVKIIRFEDFANTTQGTLNQEYEANVNLIHDGEISFGVNKTRLHVTFSSPFICDDLKILKVEDLGIDASDPLYVCLNANPKIDVLNKVEEEAFQTHLDAMSAACQTVSSGPDKLKCFDDWHKTAEGKALFDTLKAAQNAVSAANMACYDQFPQE